jgi:hypothetical protein
MKSKLRLIADEVLVHAPSTVVDIGYAQDPNPHLKETGARVVGIDIVSQPAPYDETIVCDLNTTVLPFNDDSIDVVAMGCTLAHVASPLNEGDGGHQPCY